MTKTSFSLFNYFFSKIFVYIIKTKTQILKLNNLILSAYQIKNKLPVLNLILLILLANVFE